MPIQKDERKQYAWRLPIKLIERLNHLAEAKSPEIRDTTHAVELAIHGWLRKFETEKS